MCHRFMINEFWTSIIHENIPHTKHITGQVCRFDQCEGWMEDLNPSIMHLFFVVTPSKIIFALPASCIMCS